MIRLHSDALSVEISEIGAEIHHVVDARGVERIWQADPAIWASHTPLLFPIAGALKDDTWYYEGKAYTMPKHGFVRKLPFEVECADEKSCTLVLRGEAAKDAGFPFEYELRVIYVLSGAALTVTYRTSNLGEKPMYYSIGSHEGYACEGGIENFELVFPEDEALEQTLLSGSLIRHETRPVSLADHVLTVKAEDFKADALVFLNAKSRSVTLRRKDGAYGVQVDFPQCDVLLLWTKPGAPYLCIEPWCNAPDWVDSNQQLVEKPGMIRVEAGHYSDVTHTLTFLG